jgi:hypothetical protein
LQDAGRVVLVFGVLLILVGGALMLFGRFHLPGDFVYRRGGLTIYVPIATSLILSVALTLVVSFIFRQR